jgi:SAM-dependent methyltransferase
LPQSFFRRIEALEVVRDGTRVLDLGTGTGALARELARLGAVVTGVDVAPGQIEQARAIALLEGLSVEFRVAPAEATGAAASSFDLVTAAHAWLYFDPERAIAEVRRVLAPAGMLMTCHVSWLPRLDPVASSTEQLVLRFNSDWTAGDWPGDIPAMPSWARDDFELLAMFTYDEAIPFTHEGWRGRIRACRGIGATLKAEEVAAFDVEHGALLRRIAPDPFTVLHRIDAHVMAPRG